MFQEKFILSFFAAVFILIHGTIIYFFGLLTGILFSLLAAQAGAWILRTFILWGKPIDTPLDFKSFWRQLLILSAALLYLSYGLNQISLSLKTGKINTEFYLWLIPITVIPLLYFIPHFILEYLKALHSAQNYLEVVLHVSHGNEIPLFVESLNFIYTEKGLNVPAPFSKYEGSFIFAEDSSEEPGRRRIHSPDRQILSGHLLIPQKTDLIAVSWYSPVENAFYSGEIKADFSKIKFRRIPPYGSRKTHIRHLFRKSAGWLEIHIETGGNILIHMKDEIHIPAAIPVCGISDAKITELENKFYAMAGVHKSREGMQKSIRALKINGYYETLRSIYENPLSWNLYCEGLDEKTTRIEIHDAGPDGNRANIGELTEIRNGFLPDQIEVMYRKNRTLAVWLTVYLDRIRLYRICREYTGNSHVSLFLQLLNNGLPDEHPEVHFFIGNENKQIEFTDFDFRINDENRKKALKFADESEKNKILSDRMEKAWELVKSGNLEEAQEECSDIRKNQPDFSPAWYFESYLFWKTEGADAYLEKSGEFYKTAESNKVILALMLNLTGCIYDDKKDYRKALDYFSKAQNLNPDEGLYLSNLAEIHYKMKNSSRAVKFAHDAVEKNQKSEIVMEILHNKGKISAGT